jgi:molybdopterin converting factor small subunit
MISMIPTPAGEEGHKEAMVSLRVSFMGIITSFTGVKELALELPERATLRQLLDDLEQRYGPEFGKRVYRNAKPPRHLQMCTRIFINEVIVGDDALDQTIPLPQDGGPNPEILVFILPAATGG